jgi:hypothetical protein
MFTVTVDRSRRLLEVRFEKGMHDVQVVQELHEALLAAMRENGFVPYGFLQLVDISESPIQSQEVYAAFETMGRDPAIQPERLASIVGDAPVRMQARRLVFDHPYGLFNTRDEALAWLFSPTASDAADVSAAA